MAEIPEVIDVKSRPLRLPKRFMRYFMGGLVAGSVLLTASALAEEASHSSNDAAVTLQSRYLTAPEGTQKDQLYDRFYEQNEHTKNMSNLQHELGWLGAGVGVITLSFGAGMFTQAVIESQHESETAEQIAA